MSYNFFYKTQTKNIKQKLAAKQVLQSAENIQEKDTFEQVAAMKNINKGQQIVSWLRRFYIFIVLAVIYIPLIVIIFLAFTQPSIRGNITTAFQWNGGENFLELASSQFTSALLNSLIISVIVIPISIFLGLITTFGIWHARSIYKKSVLNTSKTNIAVPDIITGISLALLFTSTFLPLGINFGFATIVLAHISYCTPYAIMIFYPRMMKMNKNLILASYDLGYSKVQTFFKIVIPHLLPSLFSAIIVVFAITFDDYAITRLVGGKVNTISTELYQMAKGVKAWAIAFGALMILLTILIIIIIAIYQIIKTGNRKRTTNKKRLLIWKKQE
ncbi:ABC transporter permease [Ureaplasma miroungigenitalium]|uniref:ABC transporter permease n=1 Tax=Ureaplasma miroungigenitalium TaxID=1042321 RepID=A0ABT3BMP0_9BACT|nr:ABC transporter permease [Ureaplasma miroungigenitalium]MCV3728510.1 ABC transporter permease [Ureaplasma miroungigenitalium]MCV3734297.1 ABC transporter permease [Ureaplasma miroungigenitalium]